jgi:hypothetical protein
MDGLITMAADYVGTYPRGRGYTPLGATVELARAIAPSDSWQKRVLDNISKRSTEGVKFGLFMGAISGPFVPGGHVISIPAGVSLGGTTTATYGALEGLYNEREIIRNSPDGVRPWIKQLKSEFEEGMYQRYASKTFGSLKFNRPLFRDTSYEEILNFMHAERSGGSSFYLPSFVDQNLIPSFGPNTRFSLDAPFWWSGSSLIGFPQIGDDNNSTSSGRQELLDAYLAPRNISMPEAKYRWTKVSSLLTTRPSYPKSPQQVTVATCLFKMTGVP